MYRLPHAAPTYSACFDFFSSILEAKRVQRFDKGILVVSYVVFGGGFAYVAPRVSFSVVLLSNDSWLVWSKYENLGFS